MKDHKLYFCKECGYVLSESIVKNADPDCECPRCRALLSDYKKIETGEMSKKQICPRCGYTMSGENEKHS